MKYIKSILGWFFCFLFILIGIGTRESISWLFFILSGIVINPLVLSQLHKIHKKPKLGVRAALVIALLLIGLILAPSSPPESIVAENKENIIDVAVSNTVDLSESLDTSGNTIVDSTESEVTPSAIPTDITLAADTLSEPNSNNNAASSTITPSIEDTHTTDRIENLKNPVASSKPVASTKEKTEVIVTFLDVGQGDSILIESNGHSMLIDAGEVDMGATVVRYLKKLKIKKLDYLIGTHPHSDHIGGLDDVIQSFSIGKVILPDVDHSTDTYDEVLDAIADKNLKITKPIIGNKYTLGSAEFTIIAPNGTDYSDLNDYSVGILLKNGKNSFLFAGDAEEKSEAEMLKNGIKLTADVLKLGHHGSSYSSSNDFLDAVDPTYAVISAGKENQYGHPHTETLEKMVKRKIKIYRTDKQGTIIFTSDGKKITTNQKSYQITKADTAIPTKAPTSSDSANSSGKTDSTHQTDSSSAKAMVHITESGDKYHREGCRYLKTDIEITLEKAIARGLEPCKVCKPPTK
ncbi:MAG: hypothetical protein K0S47_228 [Herbinix sp.]|jgi:competence protein ComEC|nr:hypothetical protein [Herbinix sp.]